ncbi:MAG: hypothetical protein HW386_20 [Gammaproteobacteria bacterium]|nr:hypothetical protein [Gammaproteobacteria bacterium]
MQEIPSTPISLNRKKSSHEWFVCALIFFAVYVIYLVSAPRTVVLEDDGMFILAAYFNGVAHSPGYPLFTWLGHLATQIPIGSVAFRVHALSGFFGAVSCIVLYYIALGLFNNRTLAIAVALCLGVSKTYWSQAIIAEVYTLNTCIYLVLLWGAIHYVRNEGKTSGKFLPLMFFIYGLGLCNHWPLLILSTPSVLAVLWPKIRLILRNTPNGLIFLLLGLCPYVWMVVRSQMDTAISFYGPLDSWQDVWYMISRQGYAAADHQIGANYADKLQYVVYAMQESGRQFGPLGGVLALVGFVRQWYHWRKNICIGLVLAYLGSTVLLAMMLGFFFSPLYQNIFKVYPLVSYSILALWTVLGVREAAVFIMSNFRIHSSQQTINMVFTGVLLITGLMTNIPYNYRANDKLGESYAMTILNTLEKDAIFFAVGDLDVGTLGYFNLIEKVRPDVTIYSVVGLVFKNRLVDPIINDKDSNHKIMSEFIESQQRPIYFIASIPDLYGVRDFGIYHRVDRSLQKGQRVVVENSLVKEFFENLLAMDKFYDSWEIMYHKLLIADNCRIAIHLYYFDHPREHAAELLRVCRGYYGLITAANILLSYPNPDFDFISSLLAKAERIRDEAMLVEDSANYSLIKAIMLQRKGDSVNAMQYFKLSLQEWPDPKNPAIPRMLELDKQMKQQQTK